MKKTFGDFLKEKRSETGFSQKKIAEILSISPSSYSHYENNTRVPSLDIIIQLSNIYNANPLDLIFLILSYDTITSNALLNHPYKNNSFCSDNEKILLNSFKCLPTKEQNIIIDITQSLVERNQKI